jgi:hypothetical protein
MLDAPTFNYLKECANQAIAEPDFPPPPRFFEEVRDLLDGLPSQSPTRDRPVQEAANQVALLADEARRALAELQSGWLWRFLTIQARENTDVSNVTSTPSNAT